MTIAETMAYIKQYQRLSQISWKSDGLHLSTIIVISLIVLLLSSCWQTSSVLMQLFPFYTLEMCSRLWRISSLHGVWNGTDLSSFLENCTFNQPGSQTTKHFIVLVPLFSFQTLLAISTFLKKHKACPGLWHSFQVQYSVIVLATKKF